MITVITATTVVSQPVRQQKAPLTHLAQASTAGSATQKVVVPPQPTGPVDLEERARKGRWSFDFAKADVIDIVRTISEITRRNFIIPEKLKSQKLTILSHHKLRASEAYTAFLSALSVIGIAVVRSGKFYKLRETREAIKDVIPTCVGPDDICPQYSDQMITRILHLKYVEASQITSVVKGLVGKGAEVTLFQPTNALIVSENAPNLARIRRIVEALDRPGANDALQVVPILHATASDIAGKITEVFDVNSRGAKGARTPSKVPPRGSRKPQAGSASSTAEVSISKVIADDRTNQLIIKANQRSFEAIRQLIDVLDVPVVEGEGVQVYYLENASAEDLASTLSSLAQNQQGIRKIPPRPGVAGKGARGGITKTAAVLFQGDVKITADKSTNALIIVASRRDYLAMRKLIETLDRPRRQVYVEAAILEISVDDNEQTGLSWHAPLRGFGQTFDKSLKGTKGFLQSAHSNDIGISSTLGALSSPQGLLGAAGGSIVGILGKGISIPTGDGNLTLPSFGVILNWIQTSSNANVLSTPHILTTDNEEATIEVGQKIPFQRGTAIPSVGGLGGVAGASGANLAGLASNLFSSTDRIDVSLKLTITPHVNERGKVRLEIDQQIEDVVGQTGASGTPTTANRSAKTVVVVDDQQTVVIGGLMRDKTIESETKIPLLGDLPLIGWLFKTKSSKIQKVNLLLVLTPYVIRDKSDFQSIFERKMDEYQQFADAYYGHLPEYRAHIDYRRKTGPLAFLGQRVLKEMQKGENGGMDPGTTLVTPPNDGVPDDISQEPTRDPDEPITTQGN